MFSHYIQTYQHSPPPNSSALMASSTANSLCSPTPYLHSAAALDFLHMKAIGRPSWRRAAPMLQPQAAAISSNGFGLVRHDKLGGSGEGRLHTIKSSLTGSLEAKHRCHWPASSRKGCLPAKKRSWTTLRRQARMLLE